MRLCKYCNKPIAEKDIWNPDIDGNGYHHQCLIDMEFKARDKQIYDKGKMDVLDKIRAEIEQASYEHYFEYGEYIGEDTRKERIINTNKVLQIIDKYKAESEE